MSEQEAVPQETPEQPVEAPAEQPVTQEPETAQEGAQAGSEEQDGGTEESGSTEDSSSTSEPEVVSDDNGQHVNMPDGSVVYTRAHPYPVSNSEWENYELTHSGDQLRYSLKPGDQGYSPLSDPSIPNSWLAKQVETQLASYGERVLLDQNARPSVTWDALQPGYEDALEAHAETGVGGGKIVE